jgi:hypothetical protein
VGFYLLTILFTRRSGNGIPALTDIFLKNQVIERIWSIDEPSGGFVVKVRFQDGKERIVKMSKLPPAIFKVKNFLADEYEEYPAKLSE